MRNKNKMVLVIGVITILRHILYVFHPNRITVVFNVTSKLIKNKNYSVQIYYINESFPGFKDDHCILTSSALKFPKKLPAAVLNSAP